MRLLRRLWFLFRQRRFAQELAEELELHRELAARDLEASGLTETEAAIAVRHRLGNDLLAREEARDVWGWTWLQDLCRDVRFAGRVLAREWPVSLAIVLALGFGIGVTTSVFTIVNTALIRDVPFAQPERLLDVALIDRNGREVGLSHADYEAWSNASTLEGIGVSMNGVMNLSEEGHPPERLRGSYVSTNTFGLLRARPLLGRDFLAEDSRAESPAVVIIGHAVWQGRYGGDRAIVGREVRINEMPSMVVGVMPPRFAFPFIAEAWQPLRPAPGLDPGSRGARAFRSVIARLSDGADLAGARAELTSIVTALAQSGADAYTDARPRVRRMRESLGGRQARPMLTTFLGAVTLVLLIACANVANLLLARAGARSREMAIRAAVGASRYRLVRQLLIECLVLAILAGGIGVLLSLYGARTLAVAFSPLEPGRRIGEVMPYWVDVRPDAVVLAFVALLCLFSPLVFGLVPALQAARTDVIAALKEGGRCMTGGGRRWTSLFVASEIALTTILLSGAGLLWRSFLTQYGTDPVVHTTGLLTARMTLPVEKYDTAEKRHQLVERLQERLASSPAFSASSIATHPPLSGGIPRQMAIEGRPLDQVGPQVSCVPVGAGYLEALEIEPLRGRAFTGQDGRAGYESAIIDERLAAHFAGRDPIGQRIRLRADQDEPGPGRRQDADGGERWFTVVGVLPEMPSLGPRSLRQPVVYVPLRGEPDPSPGISIVARSSGDLRATTPMLRDVVRALDPHVPLYGVETLDAAIARSRTPTRLVGTWFAIIALIGAALSVVGVYALTAWAVAQRTHEIGVRMALGARAHQVQWLFIGRATGLAAAGLAVGIGGALATGQLLQVYLEGTSPRDPVTLALVGALLAGAVVGASVIPSRRAARLDPVAALRCE